MKYQWSQTMIYGLVPLLVILENKLLLWKEALSQKQQILRSVDLAAHGGYIDRCIANRCNKVHHNNL